MLSMLLATRQSCQAAAAVAAAAPQLARHLSYLLPAQPTPGRCHGSSSSSHGFQRCGWMAAASAAVAAAFGYSQLATPSYADAADDAASASSRSSSSSGASQAPNKVAFVDWLTSHGADVSAAALETSKDQGSGLGLFATAAIKQHMKHSWLGRRVGAMVLRGAANQTVPIASIPLGLSITVETALAHPQLGPTFLELLELGLIDERTAVVLMLMVEKARGDDSPYAPWLQLLPTRFDSPLFYSAAQLAELAGTTLAAATTARKAALDRSWQQLKPAVQQMLQQVGVSREPTYDDYLWATSIFWSRGLALPVTYTEGASAQQDGSNSSSSSSSGGTVRIKVLEGLVPGLDFANHSQQPKCWWEVEPLDSPMQQQQQQQQVPGASDSQHVVKLMANRVCCPKAGDELTISYGEKGNEELLLLYGFAQPQNPHETLMLLCPLPDPGDWDEAFTARMQLLQAKGLRPQLFLSASHYEAATGKPVQASPVAPTPETDNDSSTVAIESSSSSSRGKQQHASIIPNAAREVLEVFVLDKRELAAALEQQQKAGPGLHTPSSSNSSSSSKADPVQQKMQQLGLSMAVLTTFTRLLELKLIAMEGDEGTGPLESDLQQLAAADAAAAAGQRLGGSNGSNAGSSPSWGDAGGDGLPAWKRHCLLYRAGQKALVRSYITAARAELQSTLAELQALMEAIGEYSS